MKKKKQVDMVNDVPSRIKRRAVQKVQNIALLDFAMTKKKKKKKSESIHRLNFFLFININTTHYFGT